MGLRDQILSAKDLKSEVVDVTEWGVSIEARELGGLDRLRFFSLLNTGEGEPVDLLRAHAVAVVLGTYGLDGSPVFNRDDDAIESEILAVSAKSAGVVLRVGGRVLYLSGIGKKAEEMTEKNLGGDAPNE